MCQLYHVLLVKARRVKWAVYSVTPKSKKVSMTATQSTALQCPAQPASLPHKPTTLKFSNSGRPCARKDKPNSLLKKFLKNWHIQSSASRKLAKAEARLRGTVRHASRAADITQSKEPKSLKPSVAMRDSGQASTLSAMLTNCGISERTGVEASKVEAENQSERRSIADKDTAPGAVVSIVTDATWQRRRLCSRVLTMAKQMPWT